MKVKTKKTKVKAPVLFITPEVMEAEARYWDSINAQVGDRGL